VSAQKLAKLQALLERVQSRGANPRGAVDGVLAGAVAAPAMAPVAPVALREASYIDDSIDLPTWPPPPMPTNPPVLTNGDASPEPEPEAEPDISIDVEMSEPPPPVEEDEAVAAAAAEDGVGSPLDEPLGPTGTESVERLMAAPSSAPGPVAEVSPPVESERAPSVNEALVLVVDPETEEDAVRAPLERAPSYDLADAALDVDAAGDADARDEEVEMARAPASSRRPVAPPPDEPLADMAFDADESQPPRHTPPPESGRLPASPAQEFDADVTGVRTAPQQVESVPDADLVEAQPRVLVAEEIRADLSSSADDVSDVVGEAQAFAPATFAAWLDAALGL
jgi:hypothetical protein